MSIGAKGVISGSAIVDRVSRGRSAKELVGLLKSATFNDKVRNDSRAQRLNRPY